MMHSYESNSEFTADFLKSKPIGGLRAVDKFAPGQIDPIFQSTGKNLFFTVGENETTIELNRECVR